MRVTHIVLGNSIVFNFAGNSYTVQKGTQVYADAVQAMNDGRTQDIPGIVDKTFAINTKAIDSGFTVKNGIVYIDDSPVDDYVAKKLIEFCDNNLPFKPLIEFWKRLNRNPSENSKKQLYRFLEACECPLTEDGRFVSLKGVSATDDPNKFQSMHSSGKDFFYTIGTPATMPRERVADTPDCACGAGIHAGSFSYAQDYAGSRGIILELLIDPEHVVSVPYDCNSHKLRACEVLPTAVYIGGKYRSGLAVVATEKESTCEAPVSITTKEVQEGTITIADINYMPYTISERAYNNIIGVTENVKLTRISNLVRYRASKAPAAIRRDYNDHETNKMVYEVYKFAYTASSDPIFIINTKIKEHSYTVLLPVNDETNVSEHLEYFENEEKVVVVVERDNPFMSPFISSMGFATYCGENYEIGYIKPIDNVIDFIDTEAVEFVSVCTPIKPSKMPTGLSKLLLDRVRVSKVYRLSCVDDVVIFVIQGFVMQDAVTLVMRKE